MLARSSRPLLGLLLGLLLVTMVLGAIEDEFLRNIEGSDDDGAARKGSASKQQLKVVRKAESSLLLENAELAARQKNTYKQFEMAEKDFDREEDQLRQEDKKLANAQAKMLREEKIALKAKAQSKEESEEARHFKKMNGNNEAELRRETNQLHLMKKLSLAKGNDRIRLLEDARDEEERKAVQNGNKLHKLQLQAAKLLDEHAADRKDILKARKDESLSQTQLKKLNLALQDTDKQYQSKLATLDKKIAQLSSQYSATAKKASALEVQANSERKRAQQLEGKLNSEHSYALRERDDMQKAEKSASGVSLKFKKEEANLLVAIAALKAQNANDAHLEAGLKANIHHDKASLKEIDTLQEQLVRDHSQLSAENSALQAEKIKEALQQKQSEASRTSLLALLASTQKKDQAAYEKQHGTVSDLYKQLKDDDGRIVSLQKQLDKLKVEEAALKLAQLKRNRKSVNK